MTLGVLAASSRELHAEERARLVYVREPGAEKCPAEVDLRLRVMARLGYDPFSPQASRVVLARISASERELSGEVELVDESGISGGKRALRSAPQSCEELARAIALSISLAIDPEQGRAPERMATPSAETPSSNAELQPTKSGRLGAAPERASVTPAKRRQFFAGAALAGTTGALPEPALGAFGFLGFRSRRVALALEARALQSFGRELVPRGSLHGSLIGPGVSGCGLYDEFALCLLSVVAVQRLVSSDISDPRASSGLFAAIGPRLTWRAPLGGQGFALSLSAEALLNLAPNSARFSDAVVWKAPLFSGHALFGIETPFL